MKLNKVFCESTLTGKDMDGDHVSKVEADGSSVYDSMSVESVGSACCL